MTKLSESTDTEVITVPLKLCGLNEYINVERTNRFQAAKLKRQTQDDLGLFIRHNIAIGKLHKHTRKVSLIIDWYEPNNMRDNDNVAFAVKFIQDALVENGIFPDDNRKHIEGIMHRIFTDKSNPRITIHIVEGEDRKCFGITNTESQSE